jgi:hypothetical protein
LSTNPITLHELPLAYTGYFNTISVKELQDADLNTYPTPWTSNSRSGNGGIEIYDAENRLFAYYLSSWNKDRDQQIYQILIERGINNET